MSGENRENTLFYSEIPKTINKAEVLMLSWKPLLDLFQVREHDDTFFPSWQAFMLLRQAEVIAVVSHQQAVQ